MTVEINSKLVRLLLEEKDMSIQDLAAAVGVSEQSIYNLLSGGGFKPATLGRMAVALGTTPSRLIDPEPAKVAV